MTEQATAPTPQIPVTPPAEPVAVQVTEAPPKPSPEERLAAFYAPPEDAPPETPPEPAPSDEGVSDSAPDEAEPEKAEPDKASDVEVEAEQVPVETLGDLAEYLGVEASELYDLRIPMTGPDGQKSEVRLGEWKDGFQANEKVQSVQRELVAEREAVEAERAEIQTNLQRQATEHAEMLNNVEKQLVNDFQSIDWDSLKAQDGSLWAMKRQEFGERQAAIKGMRQQAAAAYDQKMQAHGQQVEQQRNAHLEKEQSALLKAIPEWADEKVSAAERTKITEFLLNRDYSTEEINNAIDHRAILLARDAMQLEELRKDAVAAKKRVLTIGKGVAKPGARQTKAQQAQDGEVKLRANLRKSGSTDDAAALMIHRNRSK